MEGGSSYDSAAEGFGEAPVCKVDSFADWTRIAVLVCIPGESGFLLLLGMEEADLCSVVQRLGLYSLLASVQPSAQTVALRQR